MLRTTCTSTYAVFKSSSVSCNVFYGPGDSFTEVLRARFYIVYFFGLLSNPPSLPTLPTAPLTDVRAPFPYGAAGHIADYAGCDVGVFRGVAASGSTERHGFRRYVLLCAASRLKSRAIGGDVDGEQQGVTMCCA